MTEDVVRTPAGIKSVSNAFAILNVVAQNQGPISLKEIGKRARVSASKAHRYLQSLCACGLLNQAHKSGHYDLGVTSMRLGMAAVNRVDVVSRAGDSLSALVEELEVDAVLTVWSDLGPTVVRFERCKTPVAAMMGPGVAFPIFTTATGLAFLAFADPSFVDELLSGMNKGKSFDGPVDMEAVRRKLSNIRSVGYAASESVILPGRYSVAAPIISIDDRILAAVSIVSQNAAIAEPNSEAIHLLLGFCRKYSIPKRGYVEETLIEQKIAV